MALRGPERLTKAHRLGSFSSSEPALDEWLHKHARGANASGSATVWVLVDESDEIVIGYYALAMASVVRADATVSAAAHMPASVPVVLLARLAIDERRHRQGLGSALLKDAMLRAVAGADAVGARALLVHAKHERARDFYLHWDLEPSPTDDLHLWLLIKDIRALLG